MQNNYQTPSMIHPHQKVQKTFYDLNDKTNWKIPWQICEIRAKKFNEIFSKLLRKFFKSLKHVFHEESLIFRENRHILYFYVTALSRPPAYRR
jgi:hypothetical protein